MNWFETAEGRWKLASVVAVVVMIGCVAFDRLVPEPKATQVRIKREAEVARLERATKDLRAKTTENKEYVSEYLWQGGHDEVGAMAMAEIDEMAAASQVKVQAFRPQRTITANEIDRNPYSVVVRGPFPRVLELVRKLQAKGTRLALTSVLLSAADGETDTVTTTIGLAAFSSAKIEEDNGE